MIVLLWPGTVRRTVRVFHHKKNHHDSEKKVEKIIAESCNKNAGDNSTEFHDPVQDPPVCYKPKQAKSVSVLFSSEAIVLAVDSIPAYRTFDSMEKKRIVTRHWADTWYQDPLFRERLRCVRLQIAKALHACPAGPLNIISLCSGDGRDLLDVLPGHPRRYDTASFLIDCNREAIADARAAVTAASLDDRVTCICGDASLFELYADFVPANLVIVSGVFVHLTVADTENLIAALPMLCAPGAFVLWNRRASEGRQDLQVGHIRERFQGHGFVLVDQMTTGPEGFVLVREQYTGAPRPWAPGPSLFSFINNLPIFRPQSLWQRVSSWIAG